MTKPNEIASFSQFSVWSWCHWRWWWFVARLSPKLQTALARVLDKHLKHMRNNWELRKRGYLIRFGHTEALLLKKKDIKRPFFPPCRNWPICLSFSWTRRTRRTPRAGCERISRTIIIVSCCFSVNQFQVQIYSPCLSVNGQGTREI